MAADEETEDLKKQLTAPKPKTSIKKEDWLSTGSTPLNLAISGHPQRGFFVGGFFWLVGDSESGKTFFSMTCLAEAAKNPRFDDYRFIYDGSENGLQIKPATYFGQAVEDRLEPPAGDRDNPVYSTSVEEMCYYMDDAFKAGHPFIWIEDSFDALTTEEDKERFEENREAHKKGKKAGGSYNTDKAKKMSAGLRMVSSKLRETGSIFIAISQTRDNIGFGAQFNPKVVSGGKALKFFAQVQIWTSIKGEIKERAKGKDIPVGINALVKVKKSRASGKHRTIEVPFINDYGLDDTLGCVKYLIEWKHWSSGKTINAKEFDVNLPEKELLKWIEDNNKVLELKKIVWRVWNEIEAELKQDRRPRYD